MPICEKKVTVQEPFAVLAHVRLPDLSHPEAGDIQGSGRLGWVPAALVRAWRGDVQGSGRPGWVPAALVRAWRGDVQGSGRPG